MSTCRDHRQKFENDRRNAATPDLSHCSRKFAVTEDAGLLDFLRLRLAPQSVSSIKNLLKFRCICVNARIVSQFDAPLVPGDTVCILSARESKYGLDHPLLKILYEDDDIIAVDKKSGLHSVDSTHGGIDNAASILETYIQKRSPHKRIYVVHRLDRDTSGVMIFAKCRRVQDILVSDWKNRVRKRQYAAVVEGRPDPPSGTVSRRLYEDDRKVIHCTDDPDLGLCAVTHYRTIKSNGDYSLVELELETGRTNQIRVHMQSVGHCVAGDLKYHAGSDPIGRLALHAQNIEFRHPVTGRMMKFSSPIPESFEELVLTAPGRSA